MLIQNIAWNLQILLATDQERAEEIVKGLENSSSVTAIGDSLNSSGWNIFAYVWDYIVEKLCELMLLIFTGVLKLVETIQDIFEIYTGMAPIVDTASGKHYSLLTWLMNQGAMGQAFIYITIMAGTLAFLFAIVSTARSITESALGDNQYPLSKVLGSSMRCLASFAVVPFFCLFLSELATVILQQLLTAFLYASGAAEGTRVSDLIFLAAVQGSEKQSNSIAVFKQYPGAYQETELVKRAFDITKINWVVGLICSLALLLILLLGVIVFIRRVFEILALYLTAPFFAATIPLDDGRKFASWREMFIGRFFAGYGMVVAMQFYLIFMPELIAGTDLQLSQNAVQNALMSVLMVIAGAWAVYKGQHLIDQILCPDHAAEESMAFLGMGLAKAASGLNKAKKVASGKGNNSNQEMQNSGGQQGQSGQKGGGGMGGGAAGGMRFGK